MKMIVYEKPFRGNIKLFLPEITFKVNSYDGEWDLILNFPTRFYLSGYEYGFIFEFQILGFGLGFFKSKNLFL
jgi:hypothetical protein